MKTSLRRVLGMKDRVRVEIVKRNDSIYTSKIFVNGQLTYICTDDYLNSLYYRTFKKLIGKSNIEVVSVN